VTIEWLGLSKLIPAGSSAVKSAYDRVIGKSRRQHAGVTSACCPNEIGALPLPGNRTTGRGKDSHPRQRAVTG